MKSIVGAIAATCALVCPAVVAQVSSAGCYLGAVGTSDVLVNIQKQGAFGIFIFDNAAHQVDFGEGSLGADGRAGIKGSSGRAIAVSGIASGVISGTYAGTPFSATYQSNFGPYASKAFGYSGTSLDRSGGKMAYLFFTVLPSGKVMLIAMNDAGLQGGIGTLGTDGVVKIAMTNAPNTSFTFSPVGGIATGQITAPGTPNSDYILVQTQRPALLNISTLGKAGGGNTLTAGFVIGDNPKMVLVRAVGPTLGRFGVTGAQPDPVLTIYSGQKVLAVNDDWNTAANVDDVVAAAAQVGAFALPAGSKDAAMLVTLEPGSYTAQVTGNGAAGDALIEVYEVR